MTETLRFPDGTARGFSALFVVPKGTVAGTPAALGIDLARPWASLDITTYSAPGGVGGTNACSVVSNPSTWNDAVETTGTSGSGRRTVGGLRFVASCPGDTEYRLYTVSFDAATFNGEQAIVYQYNRPEPRYVTWSADAPAMSNGALEANVQSLQPATMTVCGVRDDGGRDCFPAMEGGATVFIGAADLVAKSYALR